MIAYWLAAAAIGASFAGYQAMKAKFRWPWMVFVVVLIIELACGYVIGVWK